MIFIQVHLLWNSHSSKPHKLSLFVLASAFCQTQSMQFCSAEPGVQKQTPLAWNRLVGAPWCLCRGLSTLSLEEWGLPMTTTCKTFLQAATGRKYLSPRPYRMSQSCSEPLPGFHDINSISELQLTSELPMVPTVVTGCSCSSRHPQDAAVTDSSRDTPEYLPHQEAGFL